MRNIIIIFLSLCFIGCGTVYKSTIDLCEYYAKQNNKKLNRIVVDITTKCFCEDGTVKYVTDIKSEISQKVIENGINQ